MRVTIKKQIWCIVRVKPAAAAAGQAYDSANAHYFALPDHS